ncbi:hypothetical protein DdX_03364 [Ditylenchus destructor]|uniref:Uncharacterized protein n=1 Tax=Ditylenchus destructor TaxID=166010 RepID=A0AAD4NJ33_9BILA|nr:hypothetical protein DdX_03364 [Ditylenchus destructor]
MCVIEPIAEKMQLTSAFLIFRQVRRGHLAVNLIEIREHNEQEPRKVISSQRLDMDMSAAAGRACHSPPKVVNACQHPNNDGRRSHSPYSMCLTNEL